MCVGRSLSGFGIDGLSRADLFAVWEALQQYIDNSDPEDLFDNPPRPDEARATAELAAKRASVERIQVQLDALFAREGA